MGAECCDSKCQQSKGINTTQLSTDLANEGSFIMKPLKSVNEVKTINIHESTIKSKTGIAASKKMIKQNSVTNKQNPTAIPNLTCFTNFKIAPDVFRIEKKKEALEDRYLIQELIGRGNYGEVMRMMEKDTKLYRALKIISKDNCQKTDNFVDEIKIIQSLVSIFITIGPS